MSPYKLMQLAAGVAVLKDDQRHQRIGAVGVRKDGVIVCAYNGPSPQPDRRVHAEYRLSRKLDKGSVVYICRVKADGTWGCARPCPDCVKRLSSKGVGVVYWSEGPAPIAIVPGIVSFARMSSLETPEWI